VNEYPDKSIRNVSPPLTDEEIEDLLFDLMDDILAEEDIPWQLAYRYARDWLYRWRALLQ